MSHRVTLVPGDCPEVLEGVKQVIAAAGVDVQWTEPSNGDLVAATRDTRLALVGWRQGERAKGELPPAVQLRNALGVFAQLRPIQDLPGLGGRFQDVDLLVVRETTEDVYAHLEHESIPGVYESLKVTTRTACERIARYAFDLARKHRRNRVTIIHKANIMKLSDGMFLRTAQKVAEEYPDIKHEDIIVDALCMRVVLNPSQFDVLLCGNLFGDIISDMCAGLVGGASNAPSINVAQDGTVLFTAGQGDPPEVAGTGCANPLSLLLPALHMLRHLGEIEAAGRMRTQLALALTEGMKPIALGGEATWDVFCDDVARRLQRR